MIPVGGPPGSATRPRNASRPPSTREARVRDEAVRLDARRAQRRLAALGLLARRARERVAGGEADPRVAELEQVLGREPPGGALVDAHRGDVELRRAAVHEHEPRALAQQAPVVGVVGAQVGDLARDEDHPVDAALEQHVHVVRLARRRAAVLQRIVASPAAVARRSISCASAGKIGLPSSGTSRPIAPVAAVAPRRDVEQLAHRPLDALPGLGPDGRRAARHARGGGEADTCVVSDVAKVRHVTFACGESFRTLHAFVSE